MRRRQFSIDFLILSIVAIAVRVAFLLLVPEGAISADLKAWVRVADQFRLGANPYVTTTHLNWPPVWLQCIYFLSQLAEFLQVPLVRALQAFLIFVELIVIALTYSLMQSVFRVAPFRYLLFGVSLNPILLLQVCQHGNFDVLVAALILAFSISFLLFSQTNNPLYWLWSCLFLGLGVLTKTVPFILMPMLFYNMRSISVSTRMLGVCLLLLPVAIGLSVLYVLAPEAVQSNVLQYRSYPGFYGWTGVMELLGWDAHFPLYRKFFYLVLVLVLGWTAFFLHSNQGSISVDRLLLLIIALLLLPVTFGPGYGPQYVFWYFPLGLVWFSLSSREWRMYLGGFFGVLLLTYLVEYLFFPSHGALLLWLTDGAPPLVDISRNGSTPGAQTLLRLPMFIGYLWLFAAAMRGKV